MYVRCQDGAIVNLDNVRKIVRGDYDWPATIYACFVDGETEQLGQYNDKEEAENMMDELFKALRVRDTYTMPEDAK